MREFTGVVEYAAEEPLRFVLDKIVVRRQLVELAAAAQVAVQKLPHVPEVVPVVREHQLLVPLQ